MKNRAILSTFFTSLIGFVLASCGEKQETSNLEGVESPYLGMTVGRGYDYFNRNAVRGDCIVDPEGKMKESFRGVEDSIESYITQTMISSHEELMKELEISNNSSIRSLFFSADPKFKIFQKFKSSEHSLTFLYSLKIATRESTLSSLSKDDLSPVARELIEKKDYQGFVRLCGTHFVRSISYGGEFSQVFEIDEKDQSRIRDFKSALKGEYKVIESASKIKEIFSKKVNSRFVKKEAYQVGGGVLLGDVDPNNYQDKIEKWVSSLRENKGQAFKVELADWQTILVDYENPYVVENREETLLDVYKMIRQNKVNLSKIVFSLFLHGKKRYLTQDSVKEFKKVKKDIEQQQDRLMRSGRKCYLNKNNCEFNEEQIDPDFMELEQIAPVVSEEDHHNNNVKTVFSVLGLFALLLLPL
ncbi:MAG: MAC/perforin domain-containing protein [Oligoflexales bacterium]